MNRPTAIIPFAAALLAVLAAAPAARAIDVTLIGVFPNKAVVQVNGAATRTLTVGQKSTDGLALVSVERDAATFDIEGKRRTLKLGQQHAQQAGSTSGSSVTLNADARGHFLREGEVNGGTVRFLVDTGASLVSLSAQDAQRLGIDYRNGRQVVMGTANGQATAYRVRLDSVRLGDIVLEDVDAVVMETQSMPVLLGMSFLNRMNMRREGSVMVLTKRF